MNNRRTHQLLAVLLLIAIALTLADTATAAPSNACLAPIRSESAIGQNVLPTSAPKLRPAYNSGNCKRLEGQPYVMVIFLDDDVSSWTEEEVLAYNENLIYPALDFLDDNASKWGVDLCMKTGYYATYGHPDRPVKYNGVIDTFNEGTTSNDILDQAARSLGFESKEDMHDKLTEYACTQQIAYVLMVDKGGRSYSLPRSGKSRTPGTDYELEYAVIFSGFTDTSRDSASDTVAHELLHLFGAEDYYYPDSRAKLAAQYYPEDIMLCAMSDLAYFTLGEYTAYTLGWTDTVPEVCHLDGWWG